MNAPKTVQENLFNAIKERLPSHVSFVHEISELLGISYDSAYRRIRGEKEMTLSELHALCVKYRVSLDTVFCVESRNILFNSLAIEDKDVGFDNWLRNILGQIKEIHSCTHKEAIYYAKDIPIFHYFEFPEIFAFKYFFWHKVLFNIPSFEKTLFSFDLVNEGMKDLAMQILAYYNKIPVSEFLNEDTYISLVKQIEYCQICNLFSSVKDVMRLLDTLEIMVGHLERQAQAGFRFFYGKTPEGVEGSYKLYCNEVLLGDNTIFINMDGRIKTILTYNVINILMTENPVFCRQIQDALRTLSKKSTLISSTSEKERQRFFNTLLHKVHELRAKLQ